MLSIARAFERRRQIRLQENRRSLRPIVIDKNKKIGDKLIHDRSRMPLYSVWHLLLFDLEETSKILHCSLRRRNE